MVPKHKKSPKIGELCLKLVKFEVFSQKSQKKIAFGSSEKFHLELAGYQKSFEKHKDISGKIPDFAQNLVQRMK